MVREAEVAEEGVAAVPEAMVESAGAAAAPVAVGVPRGSEQPAEREGPRAAPHQRAKGPPAEPETAGRSVVKRRRVETRIRPHLRLDPGYRLRVQPEVRGAGQIRKESIRPVGTPSLPPRNWASKAKSLPQEAAPYSARRRGAPVPSTRLRMAAATLR